MAESSCPLGLGDSGTPTYPHAPPEVEEEISLIGLYDALPPRAPHRGLTLLTLEPANATGPSTSTILERHGRAGGLIHEYRASA
jgi:hypothetical protein